MARGKGKNKSAANRGSGNGGKNGAGSDGRQRGLDPRWLVAGTVLLVLLLAGGWWVAGHRVGHRQPSGSSTGQGSTAQGGVFDLSHQPRLGQANAPVTVVEVGDFKCPYCRQFEQTVFPRLKTNYIDKGKAAFYFINYPFIGPDSTTAAEAGEYVWAKDPQHFWDYYQELYNDQGDENTTWATPALLAGVASKVSGKINPQDMKAALNNGSYMPQVNHDLAIDQQLGIQGTPSIFVDGQLIKNPTSAEVTQAIDQALQQGTGS